MSALHDSRGIRTAGAIVQLLHGVAGAAGRYARFARRSTTTRPSLMTVWARLTP